MARFSVFDGFQNFLAGLGIFGRDKVQSQTPALKLLNSKELADLYRGDWVSRKIVDVPAFDACRAWRAWQTDRDNISKIEETERGFSVQRKVMMALTRARLFGGAALVLGVDGTGDWNEELDLDRVKRGSLKFIHVTDKSGLTTGPMIRDVTNPWYGEPEYYQRSNTPAPPSGSTVQVPESFKLGRGPNRGKVEGMFYIHPSRVVRLIGLDYPDVDNAQDGWGDSVLQPIHDAIRDAGLVSQSVAACIAEMKVDVIKVPDLSNTLSTDAGATSLGGRWARANAAKSVINALLIDSNEEITRLYPHLEGAPQLLQMYLLIATAAADIPSTRFLGREPAGMNATGDSDTRNYYDRLQSDQKVRITPALSRLDEVLLRHIFGKRDPAIYYDWSPLWQIDDNTRSEITFRKAQAFKIDNDAGLIPEEVLRKARQNQLIEDGVYPGLDTVLEEWELQQEALGLDVVPEDEDDDSPTPETPLEATTSDQMQSALVFQLSTTMRRKRIKKQRIKYPRLRDFASKPLMVSRPLLNRGAVAAWAQEQGFSMILPDLHMTVIYSKAPVDWALVGSAPAQVRVGYPYDRKVEKFGDGAIVLTFRDYEIEQRHMDLKDIGASHGYDQYRPHLTITYHGEGLDLSQIQPYSGDLIFGPESFSEISPDGGFVPPDEITLSAVRAIAAE